MLEIETLVLIHLLLRSNAMSGLISANEKLHNLRGPGFGWIIREYVDVSKNNGETSNQLLRLPILYNITL